MKKYKETELSKIIELYEKNMKVFIDSFFPCVKIVIVKKGRYL